MAHADVANLAEGLCQHRVLFRTTGDISVSRTVVNAPILRPVPGSWRMLRSSCKPSQANQSCRGDEAIAQHNNQRRTACDNLRFLVRRSEEGHRLVKLGGCKSFIFRIFVGLIFYS
jgi:hypothetical protein